MTSKEGHQGDKDRPVLTIDGLQNGFSLLTLLTFLDAV
jgi:hypothetical protein